MQGHLSGGAESVRRVSALALARRHAAGSANKLRTARARLGIGMTVDTPEIVVFDRVQKSYDGETLVVKDLNLNIEAGEFLTMLGPSGSGKTTCLRWWRGSNRRLTPRFT